MRHVWVHTFCGHVGLPLAHKKSHRRFTLGDTGHSSRSEGVNIGAGENRVYKSSALGVWTVGLIRRSLHAGTVGRGSL